MLKYCKYSISEALKKKKKMWGRRRKVSNQINNPTFHLKTLEKEEKTKSKASKGIEIGKIRA